MKQCAVVIGVDKVGTLPTLSGAAIGAQDFENWALGQGVDVTLLTDTATRPVTLAQIKGAVKAYTDQQIYDQIIIFFSGHGILKAPDTEVWLLSGAPSDPDEAVNLSGSIWLARNARIPHVVFISDACRSRPSTTQISQINGGVIFPNGTPMTPRPVVDLFYAALPGDPALEAPASVTVPGFRGIFTECLLRGLHGRIISVIETRGNPPTTPMKSVVPSWKLKPYLELSVPAAASSIHLRLHQDPDIRVESHPPTYLAEVQSSTGGAPPGPTFTPLPPEPTSNLKAIANSLKNSLYFQRPSHDSDSDALTLAAEKSSMAKSIGQLIQAKGRESFETQTGFTLIGSRVERAIVSGSDVDVFPENNAYQVRVDNRGRPRQYRTALIQMEGGYAIPLAVLDGFIGTIIVENHRVVTVNYLPSRNSYKYGQYERQAQEIESRRAYVAVAARKGVFRIENKNEAVDGANFLRELKGIDPTLGLYSAYAYAQAGRFEEVSSVYEYMSQEKEPLLFDVAMLSGELSAYFFHKDPDYPSRPISPFCPMLAQGWALLDASGWEMPPLIREARRDLRLNLWTTFNRRGANLLWYAIESGELS